MAATAKVNTGSRRILEYVFSPLVEANAAPAVDLRSRLLDRIQTEPDRVWTPTDFANLGGRATLSA
jgi:hypothetical protein